MLLETEAKTDPLETRHSPRVAIPKLLCFSSNCMGEGTGPKNFGILGPLGTRGEADP